MPTVNTNPYGFINTLNNLPDLGIVSATSTSVMFDNGSIRIVVGGTRLATAFNGSELELVGGTITTIDLFVFIPPQPPFDFGSYLPVGSGTGFALAAATLNEAINGEQSNADVGAIETLFGGFGYIWTGGSGADTVQPNSSSDGVAIELRGANSFNGGDGDDFIVGGVGRDTITGGGFNQDTLFGGDGDDVIDGGFGFNVQVYGENGNDRLTSGGNGSTVGGGEGADTIYGAGTADQDQQDLYGGEGDDTYFGFEYGNTLFDGGEGNDRGVGGDGRDTMFGGSGRDTLTGGGGGDVLDGGEGNDFLRGGDGFDDFRDDSLDGGEGADTLFGDGGMDELLGGSGSDSMDGGDGADSLNGGEGDDLLRGGEGTSAFQNDTLRGGGGDDQLFGQAGADLIVGDGGADSLDGGEGADVLDGSGGDDTLRGGGRSSVASSDTLYGAGGADQLFGDNGDDSLYGESGADTLTGGAGADYMNGGGGSDAYFVDNAADRIDESRSGGTLDIVSTSVSYALGDGDYVEDLRTVSPTAATALNLTGNEIAQAIRGNNGVNRIDGKAGADTMYGAGGNDVYFVDDAGDRAIEATGQGLDTVNSSVSHTLGNFVEDLVLTGASNVNGTGNTLANRLTGNTGNNTLNGGVGADTMTGSAGNDVYFVDNAGDQVIEANGRGVDTVNSTVTFSLAGQFADDLVLTGASHVNGAGNTLVNRLTGNTGNNVLDGGLGSDTLTGGARNDTFSFSTALGASNVDRITDYSAPADTIRLENAIFTAIVGTGTLTSAQFVANTTGVATTAAQRIIYDTDSGELFYDSNGSGGGGSVLFARIDNFASAGALTNADFLIV